MSWIQKLYKTYDACSKATLPDIPYPIAHTTQMAKNEIEIDEQGKLRKGHARVL